MELKTKYQYTYFIYPYIVNENKYDKYILKLLNNKNISVRFFEKERDLDIYSYFLPSIRKFMFQNFDFSKDKIRNFEKFSKDMQVSILSKYPCTMFEYNLKNDIQGKAGEEEGIFFKIQKIEIICFNTGVCFALIKTNIEDSNSFSDVLNFNYKFRDIHSEFKELKKYENIRLQTTTFSDVKKISDILEEIAGKTNTKDLDINTNRFITYSYTCLDQTSWNETEQIKDIEYEFFKYVNISPSSYKSNFDKKHMEILAKWKFIQTGFTKEGMALLTSSADIHNYTKLPYFYENQYLFTYILVQYQKIYLKRLENECKKKSMAGITRDKFIEFTKKLWIQEITQDDVGTNIYKKARHISEIEKIYNSIKNKFDIVYKELNIEKESKVNKLILVALGLSLFLNIVNFIALMKLM